MAQKKMTIEKLAEMSQQEFLDELVASFANGPNLLYDVEKSDFPMRIKILHMRPLHEAHYG